MTRTTQPKSLVAALDKGVRDAGEDLTDRDVPTIAAARAYATQVDAVLSDPDTPAADKVKALHVVPHFVAACKMLGLNPLGREEIAKAHAVAQKTEAANQPPEPALRGSAKLRAATGGALRSAS